MLSVAGYNFYLCTHATDMRMGFDGLSGLVRNNMGQDPTSRGIIFIFFNGRRTQAKLLVFEGDGHALYHKRLSRGAFGAHYITSGYPEELSVCLFMILEHMLLP